MPNVEQKYWDENYANHEFRVAPADDPLRGWLSSFIPQASGSVLEIGCFPGRYLSLFGEAGYELHGVDLTPRVIQDFPEWLGRQGYRVGRFECADFWSYDPGRTFDVVASFGFIEHFDRWEDAILRHARWVKPGGTLILEAPNFRGAVQRTLRNYLDRENMGRHQLAAMDPDRWQELLSKEGFSAKFSGFFGGFEFWVDPADRPIHQRILLKSILGLSERTKGRGGDSSAYSAYCGYVGIRA